MQPIKFLDRRCMFNQLFRRYYALGKDKSRLGWTQYHSGWFSIILFEPYCMTHYIWLIENSKKLCLKAENKSFFKKSIARKITNESWLGNIDSRSNHLFIFISLFFLPMAQELVSPRSSSGYIDVGDGMCWWQVWDVSDRFMMLATLWYIQVGNIYNRSPSLSHQYNDVTDIIVTSSRGHFHKIIFIMQGLYENLYKRLNFLIRPTKSRRNHSSKLCVQSSPTL